MTADLSTPDMETLVALVNRAAELCEAGGYFEEHLAAVLEPLIREREAKALREFVHWVAIDRAFNGSEHRHGQSLYNECLNAALPEWAEQWLNAHRTQP